MKEADHVNALIDGAMKQIQHTKLQEVKFNSRNIAL